MASMGEVHDRLFPLSMQISLVLARPKDDPFLTADHRESKNNQHLRVHRIEFSNSVASIGQNDVMPATLAYAALNCGCH